MSGLAVPLSCAECGAPLDAPEEGDVIRCPYCKREHVFAREPAERSAGGRDGHPPGSPVVVEWGGRWWNATVVAEEPDGRWRVHYDGWGDRWDETVGADRIGLRGSHPIRATHSSDALPQGRGAGRGPLIAVAIVIAVTIAVAITIAFRSPAASRANEGTPQAIASIPGAAFPAGIALHRGDPVWALSQGRWWRAEIVRPVAARWEVRYPGFGPEWNETLDLDHLRARHE